MREDELSIKKSNLQDAGHELTQQSLEEPKKHMNEKQFHVRYEALRHEMNNLTDVEPKLKLAISFMEDALSQEKVPDFRSFWDVRKLCLDLFKESLPPSIRAELWTKYHELSQEAKRLKDILDEQSIFASEQIEIAIQSLENEIANISEAIKSPKDELFEEKCHALVKHNDFYNQLQGELSLLNVYATRINSLRKELIKTEMRIGVKNKFFQRLSKVGDLIFPRRKDLIHQVSDQFSQDVDEFISLHFNHYDEKDSPFHLRNEIKALQGAAKALTLNTQAFNQTRLGLSECWDKLKSREKEKKKEFAEKRELFKINEEQINLLITESIDKFNSTELPINEAHKFIDEVVAKMRATELGRDEVRRLRDELTKFKQLIQEKALSAQDERQKAETERLKQKSAIVDGLTERIQEFLSRSKQLTIEEMSEGKNQLIAEIQQALLTKVEKAELEKLLKPLREIMIEKKEQALMALPEDKRLALAQLKELLAQRKERRQKTKDQFEQLRRKAKGSSGLDFDKAIQLDQEIREEKERFDSANQAVKDIEDKIKELEV